MSPDERIARRAARQHGVITHDHAVKVGLTASAIKWRIASGRWDVLGRATYRLVGAPETWMQEVLATCFAWGPGTAASHRTAAALWTLPRSIRGCVEVTVPRGRRRRGQKATIVHWTGPLASSDRAIVDAIPVTRAARTLIDIAPLVDEETLEIMLDDALRRRLAKLPQLIDRLNAMGPVPGASTLRKVIRMRSDGAERRSVLESLLARLMRRGRFPGAVLNHRVMMGGSRYVIDVAFPAIWLALEAEGFEDHSRRVDWEDDLARRNALTNAGWTVLHLTWTDVVDRPDETLAMIDDALHRAHAVGRSGSAR